MCKGRAGQRRQNTCSVTAAEASHTDLETPVVGLLMEIREEMVMRGLGREKRGRGRVETLSAQGSVPGHGPVTLLGAGNNT